MLISFFMVLLFLIYSYAGSSVTECGKYGDFPHVYVLGPYLAELVLDVRAGSASHLNGQGRNLTAVNAPVAVACRVNRGIIAFQRITGCGGNLRSEGNSRVINGIYVFKVPVNQASL